MVLCQYMSGLFYLAGGSPVERNPAVMNNRFALPNNHWENGTGQYRHG
jgi:hypothetical protein